MVYGAYGYTGRLVSRLAVERGERPVLAGRSADRLAPLAAELGLEQRVVGLDDPAALARALDDVDAVAHCAGPFSVTAAPMVDACLATGTHYLDVTGEIDVFEAIFRRDADARGAGVTLLPGAGFDVVPTDCLAAMLVERLPSATHLELAFRAGGSTSPGTAKTAVEGLALGGRARIDGQLRTVPAGWRHRLVPFPSGELLCTTIPWGDVSTAYHSTGVPNVTVFTVVPGGRAAALVQSLLAPAFRLAAVRGAAQRLVERAVSGPDERTRARTVTEVWGEARDGSGTTVSGALTAPNGYDLTADSVVRAAQRLVAGGVAVGAHTPATAFGAGYVRELDGVVVHDVG